MSNMRENLDESSKEKLKSSAKKRMLNIQENLDESSKEKLKTSDRKRKTDAREKLDEVLKKKLKASDKNRKYTARKLTEEKRFEIFESVKDQSMVDESILQTEAFNLIYEEYKDAINEGPTYICSIC